MKKVIFFQILLLSLVSCTKKNLNRFNIIFNVLLTLIFVSCEKESIQKDAFLTGDKDGNYELIDNPISINPVTYFVKDTVTIDSLNLDINGDAQAEFLFFLIQKFSPDDGYKNYPIIQEIKIIADENVEMQYLELLQSGGYVKSSAIGDTIDEQRLWVFQKSFNLIEVSGNFRIAPRTGIPYISFRLNNNLFGWFKFNIEDDMNWVIKRFYVDEYCIKDQDF
ncbi:MAG: hypothetical protein U0W24_06030 [Bacteroidales bacterium]